ncbi:MAG: NAD-dependent DNA ligase LigA [Clostridia bacterium]|nr:NAD-dependent DNA ligase LigA [Clostridia bacterium]
MDYIKRIEELVELLNKYAREYYELDNPTVSDKEYDALYYELVALEMAHNYILPNSPTHRVGGKPLDKFEQYKHKIKLYSLDKAQNDAELSQFIDRIQRELGFLPKMTLEHKYDGLTLSITYKDGILISAATRGNGEVGELVTSQVKTIRSVPLSIPYKGEVEIQGEGLLSYKSLEEYNQTAKVPLKNPRNGVAGAIRNLDPKVTAGRKLDFVAYNIGYCEKDFNTQTEVHDFIKQQGFRVDPIFSIVSSIDEAKKVIDEIEEGRDTFEFAIDGAVLKVDDLKLREKLGYTEKFPKWALAYKYQAEETTTMLLDVIWQVSRTSKLNPLAILEPVELMGATISRATLNNYLDIKKKGIKINSSVFIRRSNDVIPEITGLAKEFDNSVEIEKPTVCPACGAKVIEDGAFLYCSNTEKCAPAVIAHLDHFASKDAMDIDGLSEKTIEQLYNILNIKQPHELYLLTADDLAKLDGFKDKKTQNLLVSIQNSKTTTLDRFIYSLGIPTIGKKGAKQLVEQFNTLDEIIKANRFEITMINDFGLTMADEVCKFFEDKTNIDEINKLLDIGITFKKEEKIEGIFSGKSVVLTGSLNNYKRSKAAEIIQNNGGKIFDTVSKNVNLVIVGADPGSKLTKAEKLGIEIWDENMFIDYLKQLGE